MTGESFPSAAEDTAEPSGQVPAEAALERPKRRKREPVTSLEAFFGRRAAKPASFLKDLREADRWGFTDEDIEVALEMHAERDGTFARTVQLIAASLKERDGRFASATVDFGERAIDRRLEDNPYAIGADRRAGDTAEEKLDSLTRILAPRLQEPKRRAESTNLLLAAALCSSHTSGLDAETAIAGLVTALGIEPTRSPDRQRSKLVWLGERPKELRPVMELVAPPLRSARELAVRASRLEQGIANERDARRAAEEEAVRLSRALADLETTMAEARVEIETSKEMEQAAGIHADHDVRRANARVAGLLEGQLRDLVATIDEALSVDPPRVHVAREKVEAVLRELERQVAWLRS